ncbi:hypothetical protein [Absidia glauca]|uniref:Uncharacterized protein n=1 Tax=Absidia glauca TaxID=4829 RepID=A0A168T432_ABSGL|nr:hypothetical protein [Absidia glauca]
MTTISPNLVSMPPTAQQQQQPAATKSPMYKAQHDTVVSSEDNDDDISLAKCMSRKLQLNQQVTAMYPCMPPNFMTLQQQQDLWKANDPMGPIAPPALNDYGQNIPYAHYQQLQHQLMLQCQQQQLAALGYGGLSRNSPHQQQMLGTNHRPSGRKSRPAPMDTHHDPKIRMPSSSSSSLSSASSRNHVRSSTHNSTSASSLNSEGTRRKGHHPHHQRRHPQQQHHRSSSPVPSLVDDSGTWRSSIYSHNSTASSSIKTASDASFTNTPIHSSAASISSTMSNSENGNNKRSLSKRIKGVFTNKQHQSSPPTCTSSLRRSPSLISCASSVMTTNTMSAGGGSARSSWTSLFRKSSKSAPMDEKVSANQKESLAHVENPTHQKGKNNGKCTILLAANMSFLCAAALDSPASSISGRSYRHSSSSFRQESGYHADLPSPAPSTTKPQHRHSNVGSSRQRSPMDLASQQDYFGLPSSRYQLGHSSFLQHGSPTLRPSSNDRQSSNSSLVSEEDDISTCMIDGPTKKTRIGFTTTITVHDTFGSQDYDRRCDTQVTCQRLTPVLALQIKKELNEYKLNEMVVHPSSRQYTQFFL